MKHYVYIVTEHHSQLEMVVGPFRTHEAALVWAQSNDPADVTATVCDDAGAFKVTDPEMATANIVAVYGTEKNPRFEILIDNDLRQIIMTALRNYPHYEPIARELLDSLTDLKPGVLNSLLD